MSIIARLLTEVADPQVMMARDLLAIALADGQVTPEEKAVIADICAAEGITEEQLIGSLNGDHDVAAQKVLRTYAETRDYLRTLIQLIGADGHASAHEVHLFQVIAGKLGLTQAEVLMVFIEGTTHRYFEGPTGTQVMGSFMKNLIDPKGKSEADNRMCLRTIYDTVATHITDARDEAEFAERLQQSLARTSDAFVSNQILVKEFADVGLDFCVMVRQEEIMALKKHMPC